MSKILWGITGSVAAIRADQLAPLLCQLGEVRAVATHRAKHFLPSLPDSLTWFSDDDEWSTWHALGDPVLHIDLRSWAEVLVLAPLSADTLAKIVAGICDNLLLSVVRAWDYSRPLVVAPAMNTVMWEHPLTMAQLQTLQSWGARVVWPVEKRLACAEVGMGGQAPAAEIAQAVAQALRTGDSSLR